MKPLSIALSFTVFVLTIPTLITSNALADTIYLKNGDIISGKLTTLSGGLCVFNTKYGSTVKLESSEIKSLFTDDEYEITFLSGEKIKGQITQNAEKETILDSKTFGNIEISPANISSLVRVFPADGQPPSKQKEKQSYGEEDEKEPPLDFLTGSTVLLAPGTYELEMGLMYQHTRNSTLLTNVGYFQRSTYEAKRLETSLSARGGLYDRLEGSLSIPLTYSYVKDVSTNTYVRDADSWDIGDTSLSLQYLLLSEGEEYPATAANIGVIVPTGKKRYYDVTDRWLDPLNNSSGHWGLSLGTSFVRTLDPAILFGGLSFQHLFPRTIDGYNIKPGWGLNGYFGVGFALNEKLSLGSRLGFGYYSEMSADGVMIEGSDSEPMDLSFSTSYRATENWVATPQITFNLNADAGASALSLKLTRRY